MTTPAPPAAADGATRAPRSVLPLVLIAVLVASTAQQVLIPVLAPLARELGISEVQLGLIITVSAAVVAISSPAWGWVVDRAGPRAALLAGATVAAVGLAGFAAMSSTVLDGETGAGPFDYAVLLLTRGLVFGLGLAALPVAALAVAALTSDAAGRTRAVSLVGAAQGLALIAGAALGGALALTGLLTPVWLAPALLLAVVALVALGLPRLAAGKSDTVPRVGEVVRLRVRDRRVWPYLLAGFTLLTSLGLVLIVLGFLVQDRTGRSSEATAGAVGLALVITGVVLVLMQAAVVPRLQWSPTRLLRVGAPVAVVALGLLAVAATLPVIVAAMVLLAAALGMALPGFNAGPSLSASLEEQGRVAGWVSATSGAAFIAAPTVGTLLYSVGTWVPAAVAAAGAAAVWVFLLMVVPTRVGDAADSWP